MNLYSQVAPKLSKCVHLLLLSAHKVSYHFNWFQIFRIDIRSEHSYIRNFQIWLRSPKFRIRSYLISDEAKSKAKFLVLTRILPLTLRIFCCRWRFFYQWGLKLGAKRTTSVTLMRMFHHQRFFRRWNSVNLSRFIFAFSNFFLSDPLLRRGLGVWKWRQCCRRWGVRKSGMSRKKKIEEMKIWRRFRFAHMKCLLHNNIWCNSYT